jgi:hypothetical protein
MNLLRRRTRDLTASLLRAGRFRERTSRRARHRKSRLPSSQVIAQDQGSVVKGVMGAIEQRHRAAPGGIENGIPRIRARVQFLPISPLKLFPAIYPMAEPLPELRARCNLLRPRIRHEILLLHASRPEAFHQDPPAISAPGRVICALDPNHGVDTNERLLGEQLLEHPCFELPARLRDPVGRTREDQSLRVPPTERDLELILVEAGSVIAQSDSVI